MSATDKQPYGKILPVAQQIVTALTPFCERIEIAGSIRRQRPMIGDIEIVVLPKRPINLFGEPLLNVPTELDIFLKDQGVTLVKDGAKYKQFLYGLHKVDLFLPETLNHWGCIFAIRTGSHEFNMWLMNVQQKRAWVRFVDGRLLQNGQELETIEEKQVFDALGLPFIPPTQRDNNAWLSFV